MRSKIIKKLTNSYLFNFSKTKKSYYELLGISQNPNPQELRKKFLQKARIYHPDHNPSVEAHQQFKNIKQAYETLKDPQKKFIYDSGLSVQPQQMTQMHINRKRSTKKYYENRWYGYKKSNYHDLRDDFYESQQIFPTQRTLNSKLVGFAIILMGVCAIEVIKNYQTKKQTVVKQQQKIIEQSISDKNKMNKYIQKRQKLNIAN